MIPDALLDRIKQRYSEPQRHYHTWAHIEALLRHYREWKHLFHRPEPVLWALYWHDAVYDPAASDNEEQSALLLEEEGRPYLSKSDLQFAAQIIRATAKHIVPEDLTPDDREDVSLFLDIDLSILGASQEAFDRYERHVREEYAFVSDAVFKPARTDSLKRLLVRPRLYFTDVAFDRWELQARENLARSLKRLAAAS